MPIRKSNDGNKKQLGQRHSILKWISNTCFTIAGILIIITTIAAI